MIKLLLHITLIILITSFMKRFLYDKKIRFNPRSATFQNSPYNMYKRFRTEEPVSRVGNNWFITRHEDVKSLLLSKNTRAMSIPYAYEIYYRDGLTQLPRHIADMLEKILLFQEDISHRTHKKEMMPLVTGVYMKELEEIIHSVAMQITETIKGESGVEIMTGVAGKLWSGVFLRWLNIPEEQLDLLTEAQKIIRLLIESPGIVTYDEFNQGIDALIKVSLLCDNLFGSEEALNSLFYRSLQAGYGEWDEVNKNFFPDMVNILIASSETNESLTGSLFLELARDEKLQQELRDNPDKIKLAINETMRLHPPVQITRREATDASLSGIKIFLTGISFFSVLARPTGMKTFLNMRIALI